MTPSNVQGLCLLLVHFLLCMDTGWTSPNASVPLENNSTCLSSPVIAFCGKDSSTFRIETNICRLKFGASKCKNCVSTAKFIRGIESFSICKNGHDMTLDASSNVTREHLFKDATYLMNQRLKQKNIVKRQIAGFEWCGSIEPPLHGKISCRMLTNKIFCVGTCNLAHRFEDGAAQKTHQCTEGDRFWTPSNHFMACQPYCEPTCENGGTCIDFGQCRCTKQFRGETCKYPITLCSIEKTDSPSSWQCNHSRADTLCKVACHAPGTLEADRDSHQHRCSVYGKWNPPLPSCVKRNSIWCQHPGYLENGSQDQRWREILAPGTRVSYVCNRGFLMYGDATITCQEGGVWSGEKPMCVQRTDLPRHEETKCPDPGGILHGKKTITSAQYSVGAAVYYMCDEGYMMSGDSTLMCRSSGTWSAHKPICHDEIPITENKEYCLQTAAPQNSEIRLYIPDSETRRTHLVFIKETIRDETEIAEAHPRTFPVGSRIQYLCRSRFYKLYGSEYQTCQPGGIWSGNKPTCVPECGKSDKPRTPFIVQGNATEVGQWPWQVAISTWIEEEEMTYLICGGTLINERWIVTAAHCVTKPHSNNPLIEESVSVHCGKYYRSFTKDDKYVQTKRIRRIIIHEHYDFIRYDSDIALMEFESPVELTTRVQPICLPTDSTTRENIRDKKLGVAIGWGLTEEGDFAEVLRESVLPVVSHTKCEESYKEGLRYITVTENMFCAGYEEGHADTCSGDSGGPMMFPDESQRPNRWTLEGIVSWGSGSGCGKEKQYAGFTKVMKFVDWIKLYI